MEKVIDTLKAKVEALDKQIENVRDEVRCKESLVTYYKDKELCLLSERTEYVLALSKLGIEIV